MDERAALTMIGEALPAAGDDAAVVDSLVVTTDMLHETTDFPDGTTRYTAGWRSVGASLSDVAAMGASARAAVAVYAAPAFEESELRAFVEGARDVCALVDAEYVGGDLDDHREFTAATTAVGRVGAGGTGTDATAADGAVYRSGATPDEAVCVTGTLGRSGAALRLFSDDPERGNELFRFAPRVPAGRAIAPYAGAMMDSSDGLARSLHQLAEASDCGFAVEYDALPVDAAVREVAVDDDDERELAVHFGEDFELVFTTDDPAGASAAAPADVTVTEIGRVLEGGTGVSMDGQPLPDRGYTH